MVLSHAAGPLVGLGIGGLQGRRGRGRPVQVQQKAGRGGVGVMEDEVAVDRDRLPEERRAAGIDQARPRVPPRLRVVGYRARRRSGGAEGNELAALHSLEVKPFYVMSSAWKREAPRPPSANQCLRVRPTVRKAISFQGIWPSSISATSSVSSPGLNSRLRSRAR